MEVVKKYEIETPVYDSFGSFLVILTTFCGIVLARVVTHSLCPGKNSTICYMVEFPLIVLPGVLFVSVASGYSGVFVGLMILLSIWFIRKTDFLSLARKRTKFYIGNRPIVLSVVRSMIHLITSICILAVDFNSFYRPYRKSEFFGAQLMDTGIGLFVVSMGFVSQRPQTRIDLRRNVFGAALPIILLGCIRTLLVVVLKYHLAEHEYGRHLNAFFILGFTKLFGSLFGYMLSSDAKLLPMGVVILSCHQELLSRGISDYVQTDKKEPLSLLDANRQGLFCVPGFVAMYLLSIYFSKWLRSKAVLSYEEMLQKMRSLGLLSILYWSLSLICTYTIGICRVTSNMGYVCWTFALFSTMLTLGLFVFEFIINSVYPVEGNLNTAKIFEKEITGDIKDTSTDIKENPRASKVTYVICESVNANGLTFFLLANAFTGLVNMYLQPDTRSTPVSIAILVIYMFLNTFIVYSMYRKQSLLKSLKKDS